MLKEGDQFTEILKKDSYIGNIDKTTTSDVKQIHKRIKKISAQLAMNGKQNSVGNMR